MPSAAQNQLELMRRSLERSEVREPRPSSIQSLGFNCTLALIFIRFSFISELIAYLTQRDTYVLYIFGSPALVAFFITGGLRRTFREKGPKLWLAFLVWMCFGLPFSIWRGGSLGSATNYIKSVFILLLFIVGLTITWAQCRRIVYTIAGAAAFNVIVALLFMRSGEERFSLQWSGQIGNSDDFAAHLLLILPFLLFVALRPGAPKLVRVVFIVPTVLGLFEILLTASRGALVALMLTVAILILRGSMRQRIAIGATAAVVLVILIAFLPVSTWNRMMSFSAGGSANEEALESSDIRLRLLQESIKCTLEHPVFGIGLGQFGLYESGLGNVSSVLKWRGTHNSYTQISSECGIPALLFFLAAVIWTFKLLSRIRKQVSGHYKNEIVTAAYAINMGAVAYSVAIFFVNFGYAFEFIAVAGLVEAMWCVMRNDDAATQTAVG
jgi:O-antigen ligase